MGLVLLFTPLGTPGTVIPDVRLDTYLTSVTFPERDVVAPRPNTLIAAAAHSTGIVANDPSTSIVAA